MGVVVFCRCLVEVLGIYWIFFVLFVEMESGCFSFYLEFWNFKNCFFFVKESCLYIRSFYFG